VLRKNVPMWLAEPELRAVVVSFKTASIPHGGEGALYIQLRNPDRSR
jgi:DNA-nicking Smr family endonuclease